MQIFSSELSSELEFSLELVSRVLLVSLVEIEGDWLTGTSSTDVPVEFAADELGLGELGVAGAIGSQEHDVLNVWFSS